MIGKKKTFPLSIRGGAPISFDIEPQLITFLEKVDKTDEFQKIYDLNQRLTREIEKDGYIHAGNKDKWLALNNAGAQAFKDLEKFRKIFKEPFKDGGRSVDNFFTARKDSIHNNLLVIAKNMLVFDDQRKKEAEEKRLRDEAILKKAQEKEEARIQAEIDKAKETGDQRDAIRLQDEKDNIGLTPILLEDEPVTKLKSETGTMYRKKKYIIHLEDIKVLAKAVVDNIIPTSYLMINESVIKRHVNITEGKVPVPGIRIEENVELKTRTR